MALAELRGGVPVELEGHREWRLGIRPQRAVARCRCRRLGDASHPDRVMVAAGEERLARRRTERGRVEAVVPEPAGGEPVGGRRAAWAAECAGRTEANVVEEDHE